MRQKQKSLTHKTSFDQLPRLSMNSNYLLIHSKAVKVKIQRTYEAKTQNRLFYDPILTHGGGWGGGGGGGGVNLNSYIDSSHMVSQYLLKL